MKSASCAMREHLQQENTTLAYLWKVVRQDGEIFGFTTHDEDIVYNDAPEDSPAIEVTYQALTGFKNTAVAAKSNLSVDNLEVDSFLDSVNITDADIRVGFWDSAEVTIMIVNWDDLSMGHVIEKTGITGIFSMKNGLLTTEIRGLAHKCTAVLGATYGPGCRADFASGLNGIGMNDHYKCMFDVTTVRENGTVDSVPDALHIVPVAGSPGGLTTTVNWFNDGYLEFTSGDLEGYKLEIKRWDGVTLELFLPMYASPDPGDTFIIEPGCNKTLEMCRDRYDNVINFRGEPFIPGVDAILNYPNAT